MKKEADPLIALRKRVSKVPREPGVYRWLDAKGNVLYVGKAKNLKNRMQTYVQNGEKRSAWTEIMVRQIDNFEVTVVRSELEALLLETNLIKKLRPKYNILMKDDKGYVYVRVSLFEPYPRVDVVRRLENDKARTFGPFMGARNTEQALMMLDSILHFRACKKSLDQLNHQPEPQDVDHAPCLDHQIGKCNGLCVGAVTKEEYRARIDEVVRFFRGNFASVKKMAKEQMASAAAEKKFEKAARLRDVLKFIEDLEKRQIVSDTSGENADIFGIALSHGKIQLVLLRERDGKVIEQLEFALKGDVENSAEAMAQFLPQYYEDTQDIPEVILLRDEIEGKDVLESWLSERHGRLVKVIVPERGKKSKLLEMAERNAGEKIEQQFAAWEAELKTIDAALTGLQKILGLPSIPKRIEGYDISHSGGEATVGSMVVFVNGKPKREHYRSFNMRTVKHGNIDDYKSLSEMLRRRLRSLSECEKTIEAQIEKAGMTIGKGRKAEAEVLAKFFELDSITPSAAIVLREGKEIKAGGYIGETEKGIKELVALKADDIHIRRFIARKLLKPIEKGKVYAAVLPKDEELFAELGFRHVHDAPEVIQKRVASKSDSIPMMLEAKKSKPDESFSSIPDLLLIDGGKGQLSSIVEVLKELDLTIPVAGLAKREEEIFLPHQPVSLLVPAESPAKFLLQRVRDEAHRFANFKREKRLTTSAFTSKLDEIPGIGDQTKNALIKKFGSADDAIAAGDAELLAVLNTAQLFELRKKFPW